MKKVFYVCLSLFGIQLAIHFTIPTMKQKDMNQTLIKMPYSVHDSIKTFYNSLEFISDLHCDALLWDWDLNESHDYGHVDIPRMQKANVALEAFTIVTKTPRNMNFDHNSGDTDNITLLAFAQMWPVSTWFNLTNRATYQASKLFSFAEENPSFSVITSSDQLTDFIQKRKIDSSLSAGFLGIEGAHPLENDLANIDVMYKSGIRMVGLTHFFDNEIGGSAHGISKEGLTEFGVNAIREFESKKMILDISHASPKLISDVLNIATRPVIVSHTGVKGTNNSPRNLSDEHLLRIKENGGLVGIAFFKPAIAETKVVDIVKAMRYTINLIGIEHVALGSDFDGAVTVPFDITGLPLLVEEMFKQQFKRNEIRAIMGKNVRMFLLKNLPKQ